MLQAMPKQGIHELASILNECERETTWPQQMLVTWYVILLKSGEDAESPSSPRSLAVLQELAVMQAILEEPANVHWGTETTGIALV